MTVHTGQVLRPTPPRIAELDKLGDEIAELSAHLEAATARLLALIRDFDAQGGWNNGFRSCAAWLSWRVGLNAGAARERVRVARALGTLPRLAEALGRGELSYAKIRAITRVATPDTEEVLLRVGKAGTASHIERIVRGWRKVDQHAEAREAKQRHQARGVHVYQDDSGMFVIRGRLEPEVGALLVQALAAARETCISACAVSHPSTIGRVSASSRRTRSGSSRRLLCTTASIPARRPSATRSWSMSTPRCLPTPATWETRLWRTE